MSRLGFARSIRSGRQTDFVLERRDFEVRVSAREVEKEQSERVGTRPLGIGLELVDPGEPWNRFKDVVCELRFFFLPPPHPLNFKEIFGSTETLHTFPL